MWLLTEALRAHRVGCAPLGLQGQTCTAHWHLLARGGDVQGEVTLYPTSYTHCYPRTPATGPEPHTELLLQHLLQVTRCIRANSHIQVSKGISPLPKASTVGYKDAPGGSCTSVQHLCGPQYKHTQNYKQRKPHTAQQHLPGPQATDICFPHLAHLP